MELILANLKTIFIFTAVLSILVIVHEWGHFITARKLGVQVERFSIGFGPKLFSKVHAGTEFMVCLIPLGGYVKMAGDVRGECQGKPGEFYAKSPGLRSLIVLNGPVVNYILAYVCLMLVFVLGYPDISSKVGELMEGYPAEEAGLQTGDQIIEIEGQKIESWSQLQSNIANSKNKEIHIGFLRDGREMARTVTLKVERMKNVFGQYKEIKLMGIHPTEEMVALKYSFLTAGAMAFKKLYEITALTYKSIYFMLTGAMSAKETMTGPIGIFFIVKHAAEMGFSYLLFIVGIISASLAIFNLLPVIPLDGGHLFLFAVEKLRGKAFSAKVDEWIARVGFSLIILLALFVFYSDFERFGWIEKIRHLF